jgi:Ca2+-binding EF-hand superfamily protein
MKMLILAGAGLAALAALPAAAQPVPGPDSGFRGRGEAARPLTRAAVEARVEARFARLDVNRDGFITREEAQAARQAVRGDRADRPAGRRDALFARLDTNRDGQLSREEFDTRGAFADGRGKRFGQRGARQGFANRGFAGRGFAMLDADRDGRVSIGEARARALQAFERADTNRDGVVTPQERQAAREALRARIQSRRAG